MKSYFRPLAALLCVLCLTAGQARAADSGYSDIRGDEWFAGAVDQMVQAGVMTGPSDGVFAPYEPVTRATVITVLWRLEGSPEVEAAAPFPDVADDWYAASAAWAKEAGVATGYDDGSFGGRDLVTREQLACFLYRYAQYKGQPLAEGALGLFPDASSISSWAEDAVRHAVGVGILQGNDRGNIDPQGIADRASLAVILHRVQTPAMG